MNKPFETPVKYGKKRSRAEGAPTPTTPRHNVPEKEVTHMPFEHDMGDSAPEFNIHFDLARIYCDDDNTEGEALYKIVRACKYIKPSLICGLARIAYDLSHFNKCLTALCTAMSFPEDAEAIAGDMVDTFRVQDAEKADHVYRLIMLAVAQTMDPDDNWKSVSDAAFQIAVELP